MSIAYFIMAHHKPTMLLRLMNAIYSQDNLYLIHADSKADEVLIELVNHLAESNENIRILPSRALSWGGWSLVQVELDAIRYLLSWSGDWNHYINLSGQDFPLASQTVVSKFLSGHQNNYFLFDKVDPEKVVNLQNRYCIEDIDGFQRIGHRKPFEQYFSSHIVQYNSSQWRIISRAFAEYATTSYLSFEMQDYYRYTFLPDEYFFITLIMNSPFAATVLKKNMRFIRMESTENILRHATTLIMDDIGYLFNGDALFARKFDDEIDSNVIDFIENALLR
ncbi:beta-1,6-N-acetylglucosaminyltransferase [Cohnella thailandensis]|uniref:Peptide O-xylosyltransferase n=1 Tax=Cohnella thailandensis TaxID=557557 RepID=A0A841SJ88_9BACL|nr:beta-1,6-N-acetylglucosaminyltransferase [Cohnella thailandensis]MBB6632583.1 hypothetical protein [Cohnella thailandensis]MBP1971877.1 hypothetical protein [Cohnella thailandensis]